MDRGTKRAPVGTNQGAVLNYLSVYRAEHPLPGETVRVSVLGRPVGHQRAVARQMLVLLAGLVVCLTAGFTGGIAAYAIGFAALAAGVLASFVLKLRQAREFPPWAAMLSDQRFVALAGVRGRDPEVKLVLPGDRVTWAAVTESPGAFPLRVPVCTMTLGGAQGVVCALEGPGGRGNLGALRQTFYQAGLAPGPAGQADD